MNIGMSAIMPEDSTNLYVREQLVRLDLAQARIEKLRKESEPRIEAMLAQAAKDRAAANTQLNWPGIFTAIGATLAGIGALLTALFAGHVI